MNTIKDKIKISQWCFQSNLISIKKSFKNFFSTSSALLLIMISMLSQCMAHSSSSSLEETKSVAIVIWIFYVSDFLRLFMMSFKYVLILLRYF